MIVHTSAIVFRTVDYQESSKIVTVFSREHGKIAVIVRGVKKLKSKFSGLMEVGNILDVVYYHKNSRSVQVLTEASLLDKTLGIRMDFEKMATAMSSMELISQMVHENEVNEPLFDFTRNFLLWLNESEESPQYIFPYVQLRLASLAGLGLQMQLDGKRAGEPHYLHIDSGLVSRDSSSSSRTFKLTPAQLRYMAYALQSRGGKLSEIAFEGGELREFIRLLDRYLKYHVEGMRDRRSDAIFEQILRA